MKTRDIANVLDECLLRLHNGESAASCAARYPELAADLAPMLALAQQFSRSALQGLDESERVTALAALRAAWAARTPARHGARFARLVVPPWLALDLFLRPARTLLAAAGIAALLCATVSFSAIAASQPGSAIYPARLTLERGPVVLQRSPNSRVQAELRFADRRLAELEKYLAQTGLSAPHVLDAILAGDQAAAERASGLDEEKREALRARLAEHMDVLTGLAGSAREPEAGRALLDAAERASAMAARITDNEFPRAQEQLTEGSAPAHQTPGGAHRTDPDPAAAEPGAAAPAPPGGAAAPAPSPTPAPADDELERSSKAGAVPGPAAAARPIPRPTPERHAEEAEAARPVHGRQDAGPRAAQPKPEPAAHAARQAQEPAAHPESSATTATPTEEQHGNGHAKPARSPDPAAAQPAHGRADQAHPSQQGPQARPDRGHDKDR
jgi:hypothetical protein